MAVDEIIAWNICDDNGQYTYYPCRDESKLPLAGGTMTGTIKMAANGMETNSGAGYKSDTTGMFGHKRSTAADVLGLKKFAGDVTFAVQYESGDVVIGRWRATPIEVEYGGTGVTNLNDFFELIEQHFPLLGLTVIPIDKGGTNATTAPAARNNLAVDEKVYYETFTGTSLTAVSGREYANSTAIGSLAIQWPAVTRGVIFGVNFVSAASFSGVTFTNANGNSFTPKLKGDKLDIASKRYNLICWYDGRNYWCIANAVDAA